MDCRRDRGDCVAFGFAKVEQLPLLYKGNDFPLTDIEPALKDRHA
jgi:ribonuclease VapC